MSPLPCSTDTPDRLIRMERAHSSDLKRDEVRESMNTCYMRPARIIAQLNRDRQPLDTPGFPGTFVQVAEMATCGALLMEQGYLQYAFSAGCCMRP